MSVSLISKAPRSHLFSASWLSRSLSSTHRTAASQPSAFSAYRSPAPPRLPKEEQERFEALQRQSAGPFSSPRPDVQTTPAEGAADVDNIKDAKVPSADSTASTNASKFDQEFKKVIEARGQGEELHPNVRRGAEPEFEGDTNPKTGEVGGPKNEPLRWGASGEWTYNGRATDF